MSADSPTSLRSARDQTIDVLCRHFADDELEMGELERRLEKARQARTRDELTALLADLRPSKPAIETGPRARNQPVRWSETPPKQPAERGGARSGEAGTGSSSGTTTQPTRRPSTAGSTRPADTIRPSSHLAFAVMAGTRRAGRWVPPETMAAVAIMGGVELDFRDAVLKQGVTEINCFAFWGGIEITVPPDVHVDSHGFALMGGFDQTAEHASDPPPDAPVIRINGFALMGGVDVKVKERGAKLDRPDW